MFARPSNTGIYPEVPWEVVLEWDAPVSGTSVSERTNIWFGIVAGYADLTQGTLTNKGWRAIVCNTNMVLEVNNGGTSVSTTNSMVSKHFNQWSLAWNGSNVLSLVSRSKLYVPDSWSVYSTVTVTNTIASGQIGTAAADMRAVYGCTTNDSGGAYRAQIRNMILYQGSK
jgi:hypothetical protein